MNRLFCNHEIHYMKDNVERRKIEASAGMHSLIGVHGDPPYGHANYFNFASGPRCVNMWMENMSHLKEIGAIGRQIEVEIWKDEDRAWAVVVDDQVPDNYIEDSPCFTGYGAPRGGILQIMNQKYGWD